MGRGRRVRGYVRAGSLRAYARTVRAAYRSGPSLLGTATGLGRGGRKIGTARRSIASPRGRGPFLRRRPKRG
jgi:hypothetical protein